MAVSALEKHFFRHAFVGGNEFFMQLRGKFFQHLHPLRLHAVLHLILPLRCRCACTAGIWEYVDECRFNNITQEGICLHEQFVSLSWKSHDHINSEKYLRTAGNLCLLPDILYLVCKGSSVISASHLTKNGVTSRLEGDVVVGEELRSGSDPVDHLLCQKVRLYR